ncbi:MAG: hypothetical protein U1E84_18205 [Rhodoferax sp.]
MKKWALAFLAAALVALSASFWFNQRVSVIQGPSALAVLNDQTVWLSVDEALWQITSDGHRVASHDTRALGIQGRVGNIAQDASGKLVLGVRDQDALYVFDPAQGRVINTLTPQWPESLARHASRAISYAFGSNGQLAIATGGGHAVALFDASGHFLGRSPPGLYRFTNGLWWQGETLWTTNTNGSALIALSTPGMAPVQTINLSGNHYARYLGMAVASHGNPRSAASDLRPQATVVRFANGMIYGRVVDVFPDGTEREFESSIGTEPRDIAWLGQQLLVVDGATYAVRQFGADGQALPNFGDATVQAALAALVADRSRAQWGYRIALYLAVALFAVGFVLAVWAERQKQRAAQGVPITPQRLGMPVLSPWDRVRKSLLFLPALLFFAALLWLALWPFGPPFGQPFWLVRWLAPLGAWGSVAVASALSLLMLVYARLAYGWASSRPHWESVLNAWALQSLSRPELARVLEPGETVRETLVLTGLPMRWVVLTQRRVLVFAVNRRDRTLRHAFDNSEITHASAKHWAQWSWRSRLRSVWNGGVVKLELQSQGKTLLSGYVVSAITAQRMVALLALQSDRAATRKSGQRNRITDGNGGHWRWQVLASTLVPGLGQWMQHRPGTALLLFLMFAVLTLAITVPLVWTLWGPRAAVSADRVANTVVSHFMLALIAAWDCWNMRRR